MLNIIKGRGNQDKFQFIKNYISNMDNNGFKEHLIVVPEQSTLQTELKLIDTINSDGLMMIEVISFKRLASRIIIDKEQENNLEYIDNLGKMMLLRKILEEEAKELTIFKKAYKREGFLLEFIKLLDEFRRNETTIESLEQCIGKLESDPMSKQKLEDVKLIYRIYNKYYETDFNDELDYNNLFVKTIMDTNDFENKIVWLMDFDGFTSLEMNVIRAFLNKKIEVNVILDYEIEELDESNIFYNLRNTAERLELLCNDNDSINISWDENPYIRKSAQELSNLEKNYYSYNNFVDYNDTEYLTLWYGNSPYEEIEKLAIKIIHYIKSGHYRYKDICIVTNQMSNYMPIMKRTFSEYSIPYFNDEKRTINSNPGIKFIMSALDICLKNFRYDDVFRYLKTDLLDIDLEIMYMLENYVIKYGVKGKKWAEPFIYNFNYLEAVESLREEVTQPLFKLKLDLSNSKLVSEKIESIKLFLEQIEFETCLENKIDCLYSEKSNDYAQEYEQILDIIENVFNQLNALLGSTSITTKELRNILESGFSEYEIGMIPTTIDEVMIGSIERMKHRESKITFLIGTNDGNIPRNFDDKGILLDQEKMFLKDFGIPIYSDLSTLMIEDKMSFYKLIANTRHCLEISYALSDIDGKALRESILISRIKEMYPNIKDKTNIEISNLNDYILSKPAYKNLINEMRLCADGIELNEKWYYIYDWLLKNETQTMNPRNILDAIFYDNRTKAINPYQIQNLYNRPIKASISRIEKYIACPFSHFVKYGLRPKERREYELKAPEIGEFFHQSIEAFSLKIHEKHKEWHNITKEEIEHTVEEVVSDIAPEFSNKLFNSSEKNKYALKRLERVCKRATKTLVEHIKKGSFEPVFFEKMFNKILIELPNGENIELIGRIDRIDLCEDGETKYIKVIDYKSGNKKFSLSDVYNGLELQLIVYLDQAIELWENTGKILPAGCLYFKIDDPMIEGNFTDKEIIEDAIMKELKMSGIVLKDLSLVEKIDSEITDNRKSDIIPIELKKNDDFSQRSAALEVDEFKELVEYVKCKMINSAEEIMNGDIKIEPFKDEQRSPCQYCDYKTICLFDSKFRNEYRKISKLTDSEVLEIMRLENSKRQGAD